MVSPFCLVNELPFLLGQWPTLVAWSMLYLFCLVHDLPFLLSVTYPFCLACPFSLVEDLTFLLGR